MNVQQVVVTLHEGVDEGAMERAWAHAMARHRALRTRLRWDGLTEPVQQVLARADLPFRSAVLAAHDEAGADASFREWLLEDRRRSFALEREPPWRVAVVRGAGAGHELVWTFSHTILDHESTALVLADVFAAYGALLAGEALSSGPAPSPPRHELVREAAVSSRRGAAATYWRSVLGGFLTPTRLPHAASDGREPPGPRVPEIEQLCLPRDSTRALAQIAASTSAPLQACVEAAWALVLGAHAAEDDVLFGVVRDGESRRAEAGCFVNTLPRRVKIPREGTILAWLGSLGIEAEHARAFASTPLAEALAASDLPPGAAPFESLLVFRGAPTPTKLAAADPAWLGREVRTIEQSGFPLTLYAYVEPSLRLELAYDPTRFDRELARRLLETIRAILATMAEKPREDVAVLPRMPGDERHRLLVEWNRTGASYRGDACVHELIEEQVARSPDDAAVIAGEASITYRELDARATELAAKLRTFGVRPDALVALFVRRSIDLVVGLLGILKSGAAYVPLDPSYPPPRIAKMLEEARPMVVVTETALVPLLPPSDATVLRLDALESTPDGASPSDEARVRADNLAYVIFTSGSSGHPKGVMIPHRNVVNVFAGMDALSGDEGRGVWLALTSVSFDISILELLWPLTHGSTVVILRDPTRADGAPADRREGRERDIGFSLFYFAAAADDAGADKYRLLLEGAKFADEHDFMAVWTPERHFHAFGGLYPNPSVTGAAIATITRRVAIRAGSIVLPLHDPIRVAEEWAVVDNLSAGRVGLSFASGWHADDFAFFPERHRDRKAVMERGIDVVRALWAGREIPAVSGDGRDIRVRIFPRPTRSDPPIWVTASGNPETFRMAGRIGANVLTNMLGQRVADLRAKIDAYRAARKEAGHAGEGHVTVMLHTFVGRDLDEVRATVREPFMQYLRTSTDLVEKGRWEFPSFARPGHEAQDRELVSADRAPLEPDDLEALTRHAFERYFRTNGLFGTPESCLPMVESLRDAGVDEIACLIDFGVETDRVLEGLVHLNRLRELSARSAVSPDEAWDVPAAIRRYGVTHLQCTPSRASVLVSRDDGLAALASLRRLVIGGEVLPAKLADELRSALGDKVLHMYGPTETTVWSTAATLGPPRDPVTIGRPIANTSIYLLDPHGAPVPIGAVGEVCIGGAGVARGYLHQPERTAERFVRDPFSDDPAARLYRTGDLARYRADGQILFVGRADHQVKLRGYRIELGDVEAELGAHPDVRAAVAVVRQDGPGDARLVGYVVPRRAEEQRSGDLAARVQRHLRERLPEYMVPAAIVVLEALPRTPNGKLDRGGLPPPNRQGTPPSVGHEPPANELEAAVAAVWQSLLGLERLGRTQDLFDLGANSLLMMQAASRLSTALARRVSVVDVLRFPSVCALAAHLGVEAKSNGAVAREGRERAEARREALRRRNDARRREQMKDAGRH